MERTGQNHREIAEKIGVSISTINALKVGRAKPSYDLCQKLLLSGMTINELFGEETECFVIDRLRDKIAPKSADDPAFLEAVKKALAALGKN